MSLKLLTVKLGAVQLFSYFQRQHRQLSQVGGLLELHYSLSEFVLVFFKACSLLVIHHFSLNAIQVAVKSVQ